MAVGDGCNDTTDNDSSDDERDTNDDDESRRPAISQTSDIVVTEVTAVTGTEIEGNNEESYNRLHKLHRVRRQKKGKNEELLSHDNAM